jgi:hypothetical protein
MIEVQLAPYLSLDLSVALGKLAYAGKRLAAARGFLGKITDVWSEGM